MNKALYHCLQKGYFFALVGLQWTVALPYLFLAVYLDPRTGPVLPTKRLGGEVIG